MGIKLTDNMVGVGVRQKDLAGSQVQQPSVRRAECGAEHVAESAADN